MKKFLTGVTLVAVSFAGLSTAFAQNGPRHDRPEGPPPMMAFEEMDTDGNGSITVEEMQARRAERVEGVDTNNDGKLSAEELAQVDIARETARATARAESKVARMDADGDGLLSAAELATPPEGPDARMFARIDTDGDGAISREEADAAMKAMHDRHERPDHRPGRAAE